MKESLLRQKECLQYLVRGKTAKEIADILGLSKRTIENYIDTIKVKFNVSTRSELIDLIIDYIMR